MLLEKGKSFFFSFLSLFFFSRKVVQFIPPVFNIYLLFELYILYMQFFFPLDGNELAGPMNYILKQKLLPFFFVNKSELIFLFLAGSNPLTHNLRICIIGSAYGKCMSLSYVNLFAFRLPNFLFLLTDHSYNDSGIETKVLHNLSCTVGLEFCKY